MSPPARPPATGPVSGRGGSILQDLYRTRESVRQPARPSGPDAGRRPAAAVRPHSEQRSLFLEILDWMLVPLLLLWPLSIGMTFLIARSLADAPFDRALEQRVEQIAQQLRDARGNLAPLLPRLTVAGGPQDRAPANERRLLQVRAADGSLLAGERTLPAPRLYDFPEPDRVKLRSEQHDGHELRLGYAYVETTPGTDAERVLVQIGESTEQRNRLANEIIKGVIFPQFVILPGVVLLVWFGLGRGLAPLKLLQQRIRERGPDDTSPIDPRGAPEEVGPLIDAFNDLLVRQTESVRAQKRFIADAAHQIKTPLAGLHTQAELALRSRDAHEVRRSLEQLLRSSERAARMVSQLLALARTEHPSDAQAFLALDLAALARSAVSEWVPAALARDIEVEFDAPEQPLPVDGHALLLRELLNNLLDNALRYTPRGGGVSVRVALQQTGDAGGVLEAQVVRLEVLDTGPGIPEAERELVFERFYRVLGSSAEGSGLGLSIVREIARQHGARVSVGPNPACATRPGRGAAGCAAPGARFVLEFRPASPWPPAAP